MSGYKGTYTLHKEEMTGRKNKVTQRLNIYTIRQVQSIYLRNKILNQKYYSFLFF